MNKQIKEDWIKALRSGDYEQTRGNLHDMENKFCCLGVLCDLAVKSGVDIDIDRNNHGYITYDKNSGNLPRYVRKWSGIIDNLEDSSSLYTLMSLNDHGSSFNIIADKIEEIM